jgi:hypothetical protein
MIYEMLAGYQGVRPGHVASPAKAIFPRRSTRARDRTVTASAAVAADAS